MSEYKTSYGLLTGITDCVFYKNGVLEECRLEQKNVLETSYGTLVPKYFDGDARSKFRNALKFYSSGKLRSIYLENRTEFNTSIGDMKGELVTFYEEGGIHRLFSIYGQISGYWTEENELDLLKPFEGKIAGMDFHHKITCFCFYPSGEIRSLTLAKGEKILVETGIGKVNVRVGISFYQNGSIHSIEPAEETAVKTEIGMVEAFDPEAIGIHGDTNSLEFTETGELLSLKTIKTGIEYRKKNGKKQVIYPAYRRSFLNPEEYEMVPIRISFERDSVNKRMAVIKDSNGKDIQINLEESMAKTVSNPLFHSINSCSSCDSCNQCTTKL